MNVDKRVEAKVLKGDITGIDVPYQMSRIRSVFEDLRSQLGHTKSETDRKKLQDQIKSKNEILKKLSELNKNRLKSLGAYTENGTTSSDDEDKAEVLQEKEEVIEEKEGWKKIRLQIEKWERERLEQKREDEALAKAHGYA